MADAGRLFCTLRVGDAWYGVDVTDVKEVTIEPELTHVPHAPAEVRGLVNLRGQVVLVLDLACLLGVGVVRPGPESRLVIFKPAVGDAFGVLADGVGEIADVPADRLEPWRASDDELDATRGGLIVTAAKWNEDLLLVLDARKFLPLVGRVLRALTTGGGVA